MNWFRKGMMGAVTVTAFVSLGRAQLMIPDSAGDRVMLFSAADGSIMDLNWITDVGAVGWVFSTPKEARVVNGQIWVSDQVADAIHRFDMERHYLSSITAHFVAGAVLDNLRGSAWMRRTCTRDQSGDAVAPRDRAV